MCDSKIQKLEKNQGLQQYLYANNAAHQDIDIHFVHGNGFNASTLFPLAFELKIQANCLFSDLPGHGLSDTPNLEKRPNWPEIAQQLGRALENKINQPIVAVGHSFGAAITLYMSVAFPHLFKRLVLLDPILFPPVGIAYLKLLRVLGLWRYPKLVSKTLSRRNAWKTQEEFRTYLMAKSIYKHWHPQAIDFFVQHGLKQVNGELKLSCDPMLEGQLFGSYPEHLWQTISQVSHPTHIVQAQNSFPLVPQAIALAAQKNTNIRKQIFGKQHCFPMEEPKQTAELLRKIIQS